MPKQTYRLPYQINQRIYQTGRSQTMANHEHNRQIQRLQINIPGPNRHIYSHEGQNVNPNEQN